MPFHSRLSANHALRLGVKRLQNHLGTRPKIDRQICLVFERLAALLLSYRSLRIGAFGAPCQPFKDRPIFSHLFLAESLMPKLGVFSGKMWWES